MYVALWVLVAVLLVITVVLLGRLQSRPSAENEPAQAAKESSPEPEKISQDVQREQLMDTRRDFVANVSHELRTPVAIVKGFAETLDNDYEELSEKKRRDFIGKIRKNSDRLCFLVEDLLQLSKLESPSQKLNLAQGKLASVARTVADRFKDRLDQETQSIRLELAEEEGFQFDPVKIERVIENLLDNVLRYAGDFSIITIRTIFEDISREIRCEVEDDGCGIPKESLPHLFERFYRVDKGRSREKGGTGLGLSIVKHIVELHGGSVSAQSEIDQGTTFSLRLPYSP